jgi:hypothetical protein
MDCKMHSPLQKFFTIQLRQFIVTEVGKFEPVANPADLFPWM